MRSPMRVAMEARRMSCRRGSTSRSMSCQSWRSRRGSPIVSDDTDGEQLGEDRALGAEDRIHGLNGDVGRLRDDGHGRGGVAVADEQCFSRVEHAVPGRLRLALSPLSRGGPGWRSPGGSRTGPNGHPRRLPFGSKEPGSPTVSWRTGSRRSRASSGSRGRHHQARGDLAITARHPASGGRPGPGGRRVLRGCGLT